MVVIPPSIDPFAAKNAPLEPHTVTSILTRVGLLAHGDADGPSASPGAMAPPARSGPTGTRAACCSIPPHPRSAYPW
jgi:hypothetical protein